MNQVKGTHIIFFHVTSVDLSRLYLLSILIKIEKKRERRKYYLKTAVIWCADTTAVHYVFVYCFYCCTIFLLCERA